MDIKKVSSSSEPKPTESPDKQPEPKAEVAKSAQPPTSQATPPETPAKKGSGGKVLIIVLVIIVLLGIGGYVVSRYVVPRVFKSAVKKTIETATGGKVNVNDNGNGVSVSDKNGQNSFSTSNSLPAGFPSDVPIYTGATIVSSAKVNGENFDVILQTTDSTQKVSQFYQSELPKNGWTADDSSSEINFGGLTTLTYNKDNRTITAIISPAQDNSNKTGINLTVSTNTQ